MKRYPLKEIKELNNEILKNDGLCYLKDIKIANITQFQIVRLLLDAEDDEVYQKDFEKYLKIRKSTISGILDTMEKNNIIKRVSAKEQKGKRIVLSEEMLKKKKCVLEKFESIESSLVEGIDEKDLETFFKVIDKMKENIKGKENEVC